MKIILIAFILQANLSFLIPQNLMIESQKQENLSEGKIVHCLADLNQVKSDAMDLYKMFKEKFDTATFTAKLLDIALKAEDMQNLCRSISTNDIMDYVKEQMKDCFTALSGITGDFSILFTKRDISIEEMVAAGKDIYQKVPQVMAACSQGY